MSEINFNTKLNNGLEIILEFVTPKLNKDQIKKAMYLQKKRAQLQLTEGDYKGMDEILKTFSPLLTIRYGKKEIKVNIFQEDATALQKFLQAFQVEINTFAYQNFDNVVNQLRAETMLDQNDMIEIETMLRADYEAKEKADRKILQNNVKSKN